jgi:hypothetical protein
MDHRGDEARAKDLASMELSAMVKSKRGYDC